MSCWVEISRGVGLREMHSGEPDYKAEGAGAIPPSPEAMEHGANGAAEGRHYTATPSPALQAVRKNMNHISGLNLGLRVSEFVLSIIAFSLMASASQNGAVFNNFTSYRSESRSTRALNLGF